MVEIIMDNGKQYKVDKTMNEIRKLLHDTTNSGELKLKECLVEIGENKLINPSHISSIELSAVDRRKLSKKYNEELAEALTK